MTSAQQLLRSSFLLLSVCVDQQVKPDSRWLIAHRWTPEAILEKERETRDLRRLVAGLELSQRRALGAMVLMKR